MLRELRKCAKEADLGALATEATGEGDVAAHQGDALGVERAEVGVGEEAGDVGLGRLLKGGNGGGGGRCDGGGGGNNDNTHNHTHGNNQLITTVVTSKMHQVLVVQMLTQLQQMHLLSQKSMLN